MASSSKSKKIYDVFLSFRGAELRNNFVSHLYQALHRIGIYTFLDSEELKKGDKILMLMKAIEESRIAIIVFSKDYASSKWCLKEVAKIMECKEQNNLTVLPVFYKVEPREVRGGKESYERALTEHESKFGKDSEEVKIWKKVLSEARSLSGWHLNDEDESKLILQIVKEISTHLNLTPLYVTKHLVGIESPVVKLKEMLNLASDNDVVIVGLWGQGGIGKTTLAKVLYNSMFRQFDGSCFLENVREASKDSKDLVPLQNKLLSDILSLQNGLAVTNVNRGINIIQHRLRHKKVLIVLDDVDDLHQLHALAGEGKCFGNGSRIIVTTRDKHLLTCYGIDQDHVYEVKPLSYHEARELLSNHAFLTLQKLEIKTNLVDSVLNHAGGLPLALEVLGSCLCGKREDVWESTLEKVSRIPNKTINDVLKISYDGLEENEQEIFLDIACFFESNNSEYIKKVLDSCDVQTTVGFDILIERSLISIDYGRLNMHDLIQSMGMDIVRQECRDDPKSRSRLWRYDDVADVLSSDVGDCAIKAIVLEPPQLKELSIHPNAFPKMRKLRLLILRNVHISFHGPICLPNGLRWMEFAGSGTWIPKFPFGQKKLVNIDMSEGSITEIVKHFKDFEHLTYIKLRDCESLVSTPNISCVPNLKELKLWNCKNLVEAHESIAYHDKLQVLHFKWCPELHVFPNVLKSKNLRDLNFSMCSKFERYPHIPHELECLKKLSILYTAIKELPTSIENLVSLEEMLLDICKYSVNIPSNIYKLQRLQCFKSSFGPIEFPNLTDSANPCMKVELSNLKVLDLLNCNLSEVEFLEDLSCFPMLENLILSGNNITSLPISISKRDRLSELLINYCHQLQEIPKLPPFLKLLLANGCESLQTNGHLTSIDQWVHRGLTMVDTASIAKNSPCSIYLPKGEMPKWFQPVEDSSVSFMASKDLYDKFLGLIFCAVPYDKGDYCELNFSAYFNGKKEGTYRPFYCIWDSSGILITYFAPSHLWKAVHFDQIDGSYAQFSITLEGFTSNGFTSQKGLEKLGFRIISKQLDDNLKATIRDHKLIDPAFLYEVGHDSTDLEVQSSHIHEDNPTEIGLSRNLQESSRMLESRLIEFDLDCPPSSYVLGEAFDIGFREFPFPGYFFPGDPRSRNKKYKLWLEE
ncbi:TMV resistance protein N isoform X2 [Eucalyptus grandis]|uniref:TMV resistance protein N isoform X2 n=1 Tax=Eucalyptus grandis TaxID=71139 RepID=UPI00192EB42B|nr:TMV resistance protein N isoform X2 [Eucalyptus grandis]